MHYQNRLTSLILQKQIYGNTMTCPLCNSTNSKLHHSYTKQSIIDAYKNDPLFTENNEYGVDVTDDLDAVGSIINLHHCNNCGLRYFDPLLTGTSKFYSKLQKYHWYYKDGGDDKSEFSFIQNKYLTDTASVLELGCGDGYFKNYVSGSYVGVDPYSKQSFVIKDTIETYAEKNIQHDVVCAFQTLEHVSDSKRFIQSAVKCMKSSGLLVLTVPSEDSFLGKVENFSLNLPPHHVTRWSDESLKHIAKQFDLELMEIYHEPMIDYHRLLISKNLYRKLNQVDVINTDIGHTVIAVYKKHH